jgi:hypothetical protein
MSVRELLSQRVEEVDGAHAFRAELIPKQLNSLFERVHYTCETRVLSSRQELAYFATAADYTWNPYDYDPVKSSRRAKRFAQVMLPLVRHSKPGRKPTAPMTGPRSANTLPSDLGVAHK